MNVPFVNFGAQYRAHKEEYDEAIRKCLEKGSLILQHEGEEFEENLAKFLGMKHVIGVANGTDALIIALRSQESLPYVMNVTDYTFKATHEAVHHVDVFLNRVDIHPGTHMPSTPVHIPVHIEGMVSRSEDAVIEDACQAIGAKGVGYSGTACYSFYPAKILGCFGDGGAIATNDDEVARKARLYRHHWQSNRDEKIAYNSRLDNIQASVLNVKLKYLPDMLKRREEIAMKYKALDGYLNLPFYQEGRVWQDYVVTTLGDVSTEGLVSYLKDNDIQTLGSGMTPPHVAMYGQETLPNVVNLYKRMFRLPCNETLTDEQVEYVIENVKKYVSTVR